MCQNACAAFTLPHLCDQTGLLNACRWMGACAAVLAAQTRVCPAPIPSKPRCARPGGTAKRAGACTSIAWPRSVIVLLGAPAGAWTAIGEGQTVQGASVSPGAPQHVIHGAPLGVRCRAKGLAGSAGCLFPGLPARAGVWRAGGVGRQGSRRPAGAGSDIGADLPTTLARQYATPNTFL